MHKILLTILVAVAVPSVALAQAKKPAAKPRARAAAVKPVVPPPPPPFVPASVLLEAGQGLKLATGERVTVLVDPAGALSIQSVEPLGWNAVAPGPAGTGGVLSTAQPGTVIYSLQGPVLKIESGLATPFNYSAIASLDINGSAMSQTVKTCTVVPGRATFELWSATVKVPNVVLGVPTPYAGAPGCT